jgi:hypothetical protein
MGGDELGGPVRVEGGVHQADAAVDLERSASATFEGEVLDQVLPAGLDHRFVDDAEPEHQAGSQRRTAGLHPEAPDAVDFGLVQLRHGGDRLSAEPADAHQDS